MKRSPVTSTASAQAAPPQTVTVPEASSLRIILLSERMQRLQAEGELDALRFREAHQTRKTHVQQLGDELAAEKAKLKAVGIDITEGDWTGDRHTGVWTKVG
jgi:hypothetical protein